MKNQVGPPVSGDDFFDRANEQKRLWRYLETDNVLLLAPRRVGKTSLMKRLVDDAGSHGFHGLYITVEDANNEADFVRQLFQAVAGLEKDLAERILGPIEKGSLGSIFKRITKVGALGINVEFNPHAEQQWPDLLKVLGQSIQQLQRPCLLAIDELPVFILRLLKKDSSPDKAEQFLHHLRALRQQTPNTRWILAGSIGLDTVSARHNFSDTINDLRAFNDLGAFDPKTADSFLRKLSADNKLELPDECRSRLIERLAWPLPYYLQLIFSKLIDLDHPSVITPKEVGRVFDQLLEPANKGYFDYWRQRLHEELGSPDDGLAISLLNAISKDPQGVSRETLSQTLARHIAEPAERSQRLRYLLDILINDGYLVETERYRFRFPLLREYWLKRVAQ